MIYKNNLEALKKNYNDIYNAIIDRKEAYCSELSMIETARNGESIIKYNFNGKWIYLNSKYDPSKEAEKLMENVVNELADEAVLFMFGLSNSIYARNYLRKTNNKSHCFIFEPSYDIFMAVLHFIDITEIISSDKIYLCVKGLNEKRFQHNVGGIIQIYNKDNNKYLNLPHYTEIFSDEYNAYRNFMIDTNEDLYIRLNTAADSGKMAVKNNICNMKFLHKCRSGVDL